MNKFILIPVILFFAFNSYSQSKGEIKYKLKVNLGKSLSASQLAYKALLPKEIITDFIYAFNDKEVRVLKEDAPKKKENIVIQMGGLNKEEIFLNLNTFTKCKYRIINNKHYHAESKIHFPEIEYLNEFKTILGYKCQKAKMKNPNNVRFEIWVAKKFPITFSPIQDLAIKNAAILRIDSQKLNYEVTSIEFGKYKKENFTKPKKSRKITNEQMMDLEEEALEDMRSKFNGNGNVKVQSIQL